MQGDELYGMIVFAAIYAKHIEIQKFPAQARNRFPRHVLVSHISVVVITQEGVEYVLIRQAIINIRAWLTYPPQVLVRAFPKEVSKELSQELHRLRCPAYIDIANVYP